MAKYRADLGVPFVMGVGGGIDVLAGHVHRAPLAWQRSGFEWLYRTLQEPRRMWRRYLTTNLAYAGILAGALFFTGRSQAAYSSRRMITQPWRIAAAGGPGLGPGGGSGQLQHRGPGDGRNPARARQHEGSVARHSDAALAPEPPEPDDKPATATPRAARKSAG